MFGVDADMTVHVTRGDVVTMRVSAERNGEEYTFKSGDVVRLKVFAKKNCSAVVLQKDFSVAVASESVDMFLNSAETKIGDVISKPTDYWYEIELNPETYPETIVGYDIDGEKIFRLYPEGGDEV